MTFREEEEAAHRLDFMIPLFMNFYFTPFRCLAAFWSVPFRIGCFVSEIDFFTDFRADPFAFPSPSSLSLSFFSFAAAPCPLWTSFQATTGPGSIKLPKGFVPELASLWSLWQAAHVFWGIYLVFHFWQKDPTDRSE